MDGQVKVCPVCVPLDDILSMAQVEKAVREMRTGKKQGRATLRRKQSSGPSTETKHLFGISTVIFPAYRSRERCHSSEGTQ